MSEKSMKKPERKPEVRINGQLYRLRFDLDAFEKIQDEYGGVREAFAALRGPQMTRTVRKIFAICANSQRNLDGMPEDVTEETIGRHTSLAKVQEISGAIQAAIEKGMESETNGGEADDEPQDALAEEYDQKNGSTGGQRGPVNSTGMR